MARSDRNAAVADLKEKFEGASAVLLTEYRGLTVAQLQELRRSVRAHAQYKVAKNTLARLAAEQAGVRQSPRPSAVYVAGDPHLLHAGRL